MLVSLLKVSRMGGQEDGHFEDIEGSWLETLRKRSSLMSWMILFDPLKILCLFLYLKCVENGRSRRGLLGGHCGFLTTDLEERVILDFMDVLGRFKGSYPESLCYYLYFWLKYKDVLPW